MDLRSRFFPQHPPSREQLQRSRRIIVVEGAIAAIIYSIATGNFLAGYLTYLGASISLCAAVAMMPQYGCILQFVSPFLFERFHHRKLSVWLLCVIFRCSIAFMVLVPLFLQGANLPLAAALVLYVIGFSAAGLVTPGLQHMVLGIAPMEHRGTFFARKDIVAISINSVAVLILGRQLDYFTKQDDAFTGFLILGIVCLGLANYLLKKYGKATVAIGYDTRNKSSEFAAKAAEIFATFGVGVHLYAAPMPTPAVSFAVRRLGCKAGVVITASHNPAKYNGYKVYGEDGCQITQQAAGEVLKEISTLDYFGLGGAGCFAAPIKEISAQIIEEFYSAELAQRLEEKPSAPLKIVYTPLNGAGLIPVCTVLERAGYKDVAVVAAQKEPDGNFPTCPYPNPELPEALQQGIALSQTLKGELLLATDPDCDRVGVAVPHQGEYIILTGNEVGILLLDYICETRTRKGTMPKDSLVVKTVVTSPLAQKVAAYYKVGVENVLTGFKYIGEVIGKLEKCGRQQQFIFGFEESCGYLSGVHVRDKDAVNACLLIADMAAEYKKQGITLYQKMQQIYAQFGYYKDALVSYEFPGAQGFSAMQQKMEKIRKADMKQFADVKIVSLEDYLYEGAQNEGQLPSSDVVQLHLQGGSLITMRPSGTEPKLKLYFNVVGKDFEDAREKCEQYKEEMDCWMKNGEMFDTSFL